MYNFPFKKYLFCIFLLFVSMPSIGKSDSLFVVRRGEYIRMNIHYTIFDAGTMEILVDTGYHTVDSKRCMKVSIMGKTTGAVGLLAYVNDLWTSYLDSATMKPYQFNRLIKENTFEKEELTIFDRDLQAAVVSTQEGGGKYNVETYPVPENVHDMVSAYFSLRNFNFSKIQKNDTIKQQIFLEDKVFLIQFKYLGKKHIRTKLGKHRAILLSPILPENRIFDSG
ncbi:MAG: DUF3108 domain-containing protein, partial [Cytophagales bacterium]|nr:DUF3108 domain-containing protein [Cytophagales bacterium]